MSHRVHRDVLPSGLTVVTVEAPELHLVGAEVMLRGGVCYEEDERVCGVSALVQKLMPGPHVGLVRPDRVRLYDTAGAADLDVLLQQLGRTVTCPDFDALDRERTALLYELRDAPFIMQLAMRQSFDVHPLAWPAYGLHSAVEALTADDVRHHFARQYAGGNMVVAVAGPVKREDVVQQVSRHFAQVPAGVRLRAPPVAPLFPTGHLTWGSTDEWWLTVLACFVPPAGPFDVDALLLLNEALSGARGTRFPCALGHYELRPAFSAVTATEPALLFRADFTCNPADAAPALKAFFRQLSAPFTEAELEPARARFAFARDARHENSAELAEVHGLAALFDDAPGFAVPDSAPVSLERVNEAMRACLTASSLGLVITGPDEAERAVEKELGHAIDALPPGAGPPPSWRFV